MEKNKQLNSFESMDQIEDEYGPVLPYVFENEEDEYDPMDARNAPIIKEGDLDGIG